MFIESALHIIRHTGIKYRPMLFEVYTYKFFRCQFWHRHALISLYTFCILILKEILRQAQEDLDVGRSFDRLRRTLEVGRSFDKLRRTLLAGPSTGDPSTSSGGRSMLGGPSTCSGGRLRLAGPSTSSGGRSMLAGSFDRLRRRTLHPHRLISTSTTSLSPFPST